MNFEEHFLPEDELRAKLAFHTIIASMRLIDSYTKKNDRANAKRISKDLADALIDINKLAVKKEDSNQMYLHHLLTQPQGWYPH